MRFTSFLLFIVLFLEYTVAHVRLNYPEGGETFFSGETVAISWSIQKEHEQLNWDLYFSTDNGTTWQVIVEDLGVGKLQYNWTVPFVETAGGVIRIVQDNEGFDYDSVSGSFALLGELTGPLLTANPMDVDFGPVEVNSEAIVDVTLMNAGVEELIISNFSVSIEYFELIGTNELPIHISPDESVDISVKFGPLYVGEFSDILRITSNSQQGELQISLVGDSDVLSVASMDNWLELNAYPNPFMDRIQIEILNTNHKQIEVAIYTLSGYPIRKLVNNYDDKSINTIWDGTDSQGHIVASGAYLIIASSKDMIQTKIVLFR